MLDDLEDRLGAILTQLSHEVRQVAQRLDDQGEANAGPGPQMAASEIQSAREELEKIIDGFTWAGSQGRAALTTLEEQVRKQQLLNATAGRVGSDVNLNLAPVVLDRLLIPAAGVLKYICELLNEQPEQSRQRLIRQTNATLPRALWASARFVLQINPSSLSRFQKFRDDWNQISQSLSQPS